MAKEPGFGMILKSAGPDDVSRPSAPLAAAKMEEYGMIIWDEDGVKVRCRNSSLQLLMTTNIQRKDLKRGTEE